MRRQYAEIPGEYTRLSWIESTGTQRIDTEYYPNTATAVEIDMIQRAYHGTGAIGTMRADSTDWRIILHTNDRSSGTKFDVNTRVSTKGVQLNTRYKIVAGNNSSLGQYIYI